jgi:hypothetical protein
VIRNRAIDELGRTWPEAARRLSKAAVAEEVCAGGCDIACPQQAAVAVRQAQVVGQALDPGLSDADGAVVRRGDARQPLSGAQGSGAGDDPHLASFWHRNAVFEKRAAAATQPGQTKLAQAARRAASGQRRAKADDASYAQCRVACA